MNYALDCRANDMQQIPCQTLDHGTTGRSRIFAVLFFYLLIFLLHMAVNWQCGGSDAFSGLSANPLAGYSYLLRCDKFAYKFAQQWSFLTLFDPINRFHKWGANLTNSAWQLLCGYYFVFILLSTANLIPY